MSETGDILPIEERLICCNCVGENYLAEQIRKEGKCGTCHYCGGTAECFSIDELSEFIESAFDQHFYRTSDEPTSLQYSMLSDKESCYDWERDGEPVIYAIMEAAEISEEAAEDILSHLGERHYDFESAKMGEESEFASDSYYQMKRIDDSNLQEQWRQFETSLKTETRFFSNSAARLLKSVFTGIDAMQTQDGRTLIVDAGPGTEFREIYRARSFQADEELKITLERPDKHLGPPPPAFARAGRMNAHGISVFYGASTPEVALAEVRPPVGSKVAIARFDIIRPLRFLDLTALRKTRPTNGSIFDPQFIHQLEHILFLQNLSHNITLPVLPNHEPFEYLATQAVADFLSTRNHPQLDGVIFPSVQATNGALNLVLFQKAARVVEMELPKGTEITASLGCCYEDGWEQEYRVTEETPPITLSDKQPLAEHSFIDFDTDMYHAESDYRSQTLKIQLDSVEVHTVDSVEFKTTQYPVTRHQWEKTVNNDF